MGNHKLGLYEVTSLNGEKQLNEVKTNGNFKDNIENIINALNNYNKGMNTSLLLHVEVIDLI